MAIGESRRRCAGRRCDRRNGDSVRLLAGRDAQRIDYFPRKPAYVIPYAGWIYTQWRVLFCRQKYNQFTTGIVRHSDAVRSAEKLAPAMLAHAILNGDIALIPDEALHDREASRVTWTPSDRPGRRYVYRLVEDRWLLDSIADASGREGEEEHGSSWVYLYSKAASGIAADAPIVPTSAISRLRIDGRAIRIPGVEEGTVRDIDSTHEYLLAKFDVLAPHEKPYIDPAGTERYNEATGEIFDPDRNVIDRVRPIKQTSAVFRWSAMIASVSVAALVAGVGLWWFRRGRQ